MAIFAVGGLFSGFPVKISRNGRQIRIPGQKLPSWGSFWADWAIFKKWQFSPWGVDFPVFWSKYQKTDAGFGLLTTNYLYEQVFRPIGRFFKKWQFSQRGVHFLVFRWKYQKMDHGFGFLAPNYLLGEVFVYIRRFLKSGNFPRGWSRQLYLVSGFSSV